MSDEQQVFIQDVKARIRAGQRLDLFMMRDQSHKPQGREWVPNYGRWTDDPSVVESSGMDLKIIPTSRLAVLLEWIDADVEGLHSMFHPDVGVGTARIFVHEGESSIYPLPASGLGLIGPKEPAVPVEENEDGYVRSPTDVLDDHLGDLAQVVAHEAATQAQEIALAAYDHAMTVFKAKYLAHLQTVLAEMWGVRAILEGELAVHKAAVEPVASDLFGTPALHQPEQAEESRK